MPALAKNNSIVNERQFILATRDTGYRSTAAAIAELVDNSIQAGASIVRIFIRQEGVGNERQISIGVLDNGSGMDPETLRIAIQFAGSSRFDDRTGLGRFGMGLPNSSVSQARRVDVYSWRERGQILHSYLDVDEIATGQTTGIPKPRAAEVPDWIVKFIRRRSGTLVLWTRCDKLDARKARTIAEKLHRPLGQRFRNFLFSGNKIYVNDDSVLPFDPLFLVVEDGSPMATPFGDTLTFEFRQPSDPTRSSIVQVRFSELPIASWHSFPSDKKREMGIAKGAGVSIVRSGREIDFGWYFMGSKRKENYDDWWRCEVAFEPELDDLFGVTHSKQEINPREVLRSELSTHLESIAQTLNSRARAAFALVRKQENEDLSVAETRAAERERSLPPPATIPRNEENTRHTVKQKSSRFTPAEKATLQFRIRTEPLDLPDVYISSLSAEGRVVVTVNENHGFFDQVFAKALEGSSKNLKDGIDALLLALARAELSLDDEASRLAVKQYRQSFSNILASYLGD